MLRAWAGIFAIGLGVRLLALALIPPGADIANFETSGRVVAGGGNIYVEQYYYNYSPLPGQVAAAVINGGGVFRNQWRALTTAGDLVAAVLVAMVIGRRQLWMFALIWLNPGLIFYTAWDAAFDVWTVVPLLAALCLLRWSGWRSSVS